MGCGPEFSTVHRYIGYALSIAVLLGCAKIAVSRGAPSRAMVLALVWLVVVMQATGTVPAALCRGQAPLTILDVSALVCFGVIFAIACFVTYWHISRLRRARKSGSQGSENGENGTNAVSRRQN
jgi:FtsH-binding integral membrane protein